MILWASMEVQLWIYDLTQGMARQLSMPLLGMQIDAVYHSSLVFDGIEYFFGAGVQTCYPGTSHHGQPMEKVNMGTTHLPIETILDYLDGLKEIYTPESYDLFAHNCNNFTNDFAMFLVGRGIPDHITNLPKRVLETPFGQMLKPQIDASMRAVTQSPALSRDRYPLAIGEPRIPRNSSTAEAAAANETPTSKSASYGTVLKVLSLSSLDKYFQIAAQTALTIFFTSSTCPPCKLAYPTYDRLAEQYSNAIFVKVDVNEAQEVAARYQIRATPTFMTFSRGAKQDEWAGADPNVLKANVDRLLLETFPPHPHTMLKVPTFQFGSMKLVSYTKTPPLEKLMAKLGGAAKDTDLATLRNFIEARSVNPREAQVPNLQNIASALQNQILSLPIDVRFAAVDLLRCACADPRVSGFFAEERGISTVLAIVQHVNDLTDCPHNLRLVTIQLLCNILATKVCTTELLKPSNELASAAVQLITSSLLDVAHPTTRVAAASLAFNITTANYRLRRENDKEALEDGLQVALAASLIEALSQEENDDVVKALLMAFGYLVYFAPQDHEAIDLCRAMDAKQIVNDCKTQPDLSKEVARLL